MKRRLALPAVAATVATLTAPIVWAQAPAGRLMRLGGLGSFANPEDFHAAFAQRGWQIGRNLIVEYRHTRGDRQLYQSLARELVDLRVDVIYAIGDLAAVAAFNATRSIPIVAMMTAPIEQGLAKSLAQPGGNVTGMVFQALEYQGKQVDILRAIQPGLKRMGITAIDTIPSRAWQASWQVSLEKAGITMVALPWPQRVADIETTLVAAKREQVQAVEFSLNFALRGPGWEQITAWAISNKVLTSGAEYSRGESAIAFGANGAKSLEQFASQVDRVLRGADPAQTPIQQPTVFDLVINRKIIRAIGLTVPRAVLVQATEVID